MFSIAVVFVTFCVCVASANKTLCDVCACPYEANDDKEFLIVKVDCSYIGVNLNSTLNLPSSIHQLDLSSNNITCVLQSRLLTSKSIEVLSLNKNSIASVDVNALALPELRKLDLSDNQLEFLDPEVFSRTKQLDYLNLASNRFTTFPTMMFHHLNVLSEIVLDGNRLGESFRDISLFQRNGLALNNAIRSISLRRISFDRLPENFFVYAYDLRSLFLSGNNLTTISELPFTLEVLDLSENPISQLDPEDFSELPALKELYLNDLTIKEVKDYMFVSQKGLVKLFIENNKNLTKFSPRAFGEEFLEDPDYFTLEELSLRGSRLSSLSEKLEVPFGQLRRLDLQGNPWTCDCYLVWLKKLQIEASDYEFLRCANPLYLRNAKIFDTHDDRFRCIEVEKHIIGGAIGITAFCVLLSFIAIWLFFCLPRSQKRGKVVNIYYAPLNTYSLLHMTPGSGSLLKDKGADSYVTPVVGLLMLHVLFYLKLTLLNAVLLEMC